MPGTRKKKTPARKPRKDEGDILEIARKNFGFTSLRPGQSDAIESLRRGRDCLVVMPTGSGKSAIYQITGLLLEGSTIVISPLIALQKDQVDSINSHHASGAVVINSSQRVAEARAAIEAIEEGSGKYIFLAPEQLRRQETIEALESVKISLFVVDEAHCISEWGHDFRPDYLQLGPAIERFGHPVVLAMTATASPQLRDEIVTRLGMRKPLTIVRGFDRPNISLRVDHFEKESEKREALVHRVNWAKKPGIVYVATRKNAELLAQALAEEEVSALHYHAGLKPSERKDIQDRFMSGDCDVIVATNAFGMGIDKADVRFVYHYDIPDSLDSYYQEIGRAGRDGEKAEAILFFREEDMRVRKFQSGEGRIDERQVEEVIDVIADQEGPVEPEEIAEKVDLSDRKLQVALHRLEDAGVVDVLPTGEVKIDEAADLTEAVQEASEEQEHRKAIKQERLRQMQDYADTTKCRREHMLRYFGDDYTGPCNNCDRCNENGSGGSRDIAVDPSVGTRREVA